MTELPTELFIVLILFQSQVYGLVRTDDQSSSFFKQKNNARVKGHVIKTLNAASFTTCAQLCLVNSLCNSVNFKTRGVCELNDELPNDSNVESDHKVMLGWWISIQMDTFIFTSLGARGQYGPTNSHGYNGSNLEAKVQVEKGIQSWTVPFTGNYIIEAYGASGANGTCSESSCQGWSAGGYGAKITGTFTLKKGTRLKLIVGQEGLLRFPHNYSPGGGGGGSFVVVSDMNTPLIIAGGGGGGGITVNGAARDGDPGQMSTNGSRYGGSHGGGGLRYEKTKKQFSPQLPPFFSSSGAGFKKDGDSAGGTQAQSFLNGGAGGFGDTQGGFGGGGFGLAYSPGGGGGYSGGGVVMDSGVGQAGGGGSINNGYNQVNQAGYNHGDGRILIKLFQ
ncbi:ALK tyrosine kinase receptor [Exaiptasia diaphana]|uniref:receptor protein-tyrosine kinase n=1 Tax=Exaiptasia diaphana TaxID=2652724 RepID=A0A913YW17_EXADI|nr:ALK tyrosine kinase receptor [Exaiptasia diaphana]